MDRILADPTGEVYFGRDLWRVADADIHRYRICRQIAEAADSLRPHSDRNRLGRQIAEAVAHSLRRR